MQSAFKIVQVSDGHQPAIHGYFDICPESPNGNYVVYTKLPVDGSSDYHVWIASPEGLNQCQVGPPAVGGYHSGLRPQWIDNTTIAYGVPKHSCPQTAVVDIVAETFYLVPGVLRMYSPITRRGLTCTNELRKIVAPAGDEAVYLMDLEHRTRELVFTVRDAQAIHPLAEFIDPDIARFKHTKWSIDGKYFSVVLHNADTAAFKEGLIDPSHRIKSILIANADGSEIRYLTEFGHHPAWHPSRHAVVTGEHRAGLGSCLVTHPVDGSEPTVFINATGNHSAISPDGRLVVTDYYNDPQYGSGRIAIIDVQTGTSTTLAIFELPGPIFANCHAHPTWSRDGRRVYFNCSETGTPQLYAIDLDDPHLS